MSRDRKNNSGRVYNIILDMVLTLKREREYSRVFSSQSRSSSVPSSMCDSTSFYRFPLGEVCVSGQDNII